MESSETVQRVSRMEGDVQHIDRALQRHLETCEKAHEKIGERFTKLERIIWLASGAVTAILTIVQYAVTKH